MQRALKDLLDNGSAEQISESRTAGSGFPIQRVVVSFVHEGNSPQPLISYTNPPAPRSSSTSRGDWWTLANESVTLFADELSASLHPRLLDRLIRAVNDAPKDRFDHNSSSLRMIPDFLRAKMASHRRSGGTRCTSQKGRQRSDRAVFTGGVQRRRSARPQHPQTLHVRPLRSDPIGGEALAMSKGKKNPEKPMSKKFAALIEQLQRHRGVRELEKRFFIVCEDDKSAPNYFKALKKHFNLSATSIQVAGSGGNSQPIQVVERAVELKERAADPESGTEPFDQVWCVIDGDYGNKINNARAKAKAKGVELAISTKCFEYWVLLHFEESDTSTMDCDALVRSLRKKHLPSNIRRAHVTFAISLSSVHDACKRAEKLRKPGIARGELPEVQNPCSEVYKLVNAILGS